MPHYLCNAAVAIDKVKLVKLKLMMIGNVYLIE